MTDSNTLFLQAASAAMNELDLRYMEADLDGKVQLKEELDKAMMNFSEIRCRILEREVICTTEDVSRMQSLRKDIERAEVVQSLLSVMAQLTGFFARL